MEHFRSLPRLDRDDAVLVTSAMTKTSVDRCSDYVDIFHPKQYPPPLGGTLVPTEEIEALREKVTALASEYGFPKRNRAKGASYSEFDARLGNILFDCLQISPAEAGTEEVWNFLSLAVFPDVSKWRYQNDNRKEDYERWIGKPRNTFRKAWWRAYCLGPDLNLTLGEDEGVAIMERPTFGMNPTIAKTIASVHHKQSLELDSSKSDVLRRVMVQLGKLSSIMNFDVLTPEQTTTLVREVYQETLDSLLSIE